MAKVSMVITFLVISSSLAFTRDSSITLQSHSTSIYSSNSLPAASFQRTNWTSSTSVLSSGSTSSPPFAPYSAAVLSASSASNGSVVVATMPSTSSPTSVVFGSILPNSISSTSFSNYSSTTTSTSSNTTALSTVINSTPSSLGTGANTSPGQPLSSRTATITNVGSVNISQTSSLPPTNISSTTPTSLTTLTISYNASSSISSVAPFLATGATQSPIQPLSSITTTAPSVVSSNFSRTSSLTTDITSIQPISFSMSTILPNASSSGRNSASSSSSISLAGVGTLLPTTSSSKLSEVPVSFSGTWTDTSTASVSFTWFDIPTATAEGATATSEAALLGGLFFALQANRHWLTDPSLKSQFLKDVEHTKDEAISLFNDLDVKVPEPDCSNTKRRKRNPVSEKQLRRYIRNRSIIGSIAGAIGDAIGDAAKLISCAVNVVKNLVDSVNVDVPDIDEIENLTDTLAEIGRHLEEEDNTKSDSPSSTNPSSQSPTSTSTTVSTTSSSSSSSSSSSRICSFTDTMHLCKSIEAPTARSAIIEIAKYTSVNYDPALAASILQAQVTQTTAFPSAWARTTVTPLSVSSMKNASTALISTNATSQGLSTVSATSTNTIPSGLSSTTTPISTLPVSSPNQTLFNSTGLEESTLVVSTPMPSSLPPASPTVESTSAAPVTTLLPASTPDPPPTSTARPPPVASPSREVKFMFFHSVGTKGQVAGNEWWMYLYPTTSFADVHVCQAKSGLFNDDAIKMTDPLPSPVAWPLGTFHLGNGDLGEGCSYIGDRSGPGILTCPGKPDSSCIADPTTAPVVCDKFETLYPMVVCGLP